MSNQALPQKSSQILERYLENCQNLGLILDKYAPWQPTGRGQWDLQVEHSIRRRGKDQVVSATGGEAKGIWLNTFRRSKPQETPSVFESSRCDEELMHQKQQFWREMVRSGKGLAYALTTSSRLVVGLGTSHVLETAITLDRNTGLPYIPGSAIKGLARAWGLIEIARQLDFELTGANDAVLNDLAELLMQDISGADRRTAVVNLLGQEPSVQAENYMDGFQFIFGTQGIAGAVCFLDAIYGGEKAPDFATDVMTPHYVQYYTSGGNEAPTDEDNPNPVSFLTVEQGAKFHFGLVWRASAWLSGINLSREDVLTEAGNWLLRALTNLGAGGKTAAGYGSFRAKSLQILEQA